MVTGPSDLASPSSFPSIPGLVSDALNISLASLLGVGVIMGTWFLLNLVMPISITKAIGKDRNPAVGVLVLSVFVGLGIILQSALQVHAAPADPTAPTVVDPAISPR